MKYVRLEKRIRLLLRTDFFYFLSPIRNSVEHICLFSFLILYCGAIICFYFYRLRMIYSSKDVGESCDANIVWLILRYTTTHFYTIILEIIDWLKIDEVLFPRKLSISNWVVLSLVQFHCVISTSWILLFHIAIVLHSKWVTSK